MNSPSSLFPFNVPADAKERKQALDAGRSFLVQAPAGSGKTELLIQRFLLLLGHVDEPEEIAAITFTRKAAGEMRDRVLAALARAYSGGPTGNPREIPQNELAEAALRRSSEREWDLLRNPGRLRIDTIDALSHQIVRAMPWLSRFGAMPEPVEDASELYRMAASRTLRLLGEGNARDAECIRILLRRLDVNAGACERLLAQMLSRREQWLPLIAGVDPAVLRPFLETNLADLVRGELEKVRDLARERSLSPLPAIDPHALPAWKDLAESLLTKAGEWRKRSAEADALRLAGNASEPLREALHALRDLPAPYYQDGQWEVLEALFHALQLAVANLRIEFQSRGQVDFSEITQAALDALGPVEHPTDLALSLGHRIRHLLVDEFQDTSQAQRELLLKLTAGWEDGDDRTLFLVGDPMQSIYRFREAEVGVFLDTRAHGLGPLHPEPLSIHVNFRSSPEVVSWVNRCFPQVFPLTEDIAMGAVTFAESVAFRWESGAVRVHPLFDQKDDTAEATLVADLIAEARRDNPQGSIAVLVRARPHLREIVKELRSRGWRYQAVKVDTLADSPSVRDLLALTRALVHPADRPAWLAVLRAPWCGLTLHDLEAIAGGDPVSAIWTLLRRPGLSLASDAAARVRKLAEALEPAMANRRRMPLRDWIEDAWLRLGGPQCCQSEARRADAEAFLDLLEDFDEGGDLPRFDSIESRLHNLFTKPDPEADPNLQVMTIHQAKGLEFDTVILPGLGKAAKQDEPRLMHWLRNGDRLVLAPVAAANEEGEIYRYLGAVEARKESNELSRLLYVAVTRARRTLHLVGNTGIKSKGEMARPLRGSLLHRLWPAVEEEFAKAFASHRPAPKQPGGNRKPPGLLRRVAADWHAPRPPAPVPVPAESPVDLTFDWTGNTLRHIGVVTHAYLHRCIRESGDAGWVASQRPAVKRMLLSLGVPAGEAAEAAAKVESALVNTLLDKRGAWILSSHHLAAQSEAALTGVLHDGTVIRGVVDRTFVDAQGVRWVVDFKTSAHEGAGLDWFLDSEQARYRTQLERYGRMFQILDSGREIRLGLYFPLLRGWREWTLS